MTGGDPLYAGLWRAAAWLAVLFILSGLAEWLG